MNTEKYNVNLLLCDWQLTKHSLNRSNTVNPSPSGTSSRSKQLICKYLTQAWYKNKPSSSQQTPCGPAWHSLNPMDDSEPNQSSTQSLILKGCDRPFKAALNRLSTCQYTARSPCFTHTLSLNFWPCCVCHSLTKRCSLSSVTTVDVLVGSVTLSLLVLSSLFGCHYRSLAHTPDNIGQLLCIVSVR